MADQPKPKSIEYFREELGRFRDMMGTRSFWAKDIDTIMDARKGLSYVWVITVDPPGENDEKMLMVTMDEFNRRMAMVQKHGLPPIQHPGEAGSLLK